MSLGTGSQSRSLPRRTGIGTVWAPLSRGRGGGAPCAPQGRARSQAQRARGERGARGRGARQQERGGSARGGRGARGAEGRGGVRGGLHLSRLGCCPPRPAAPPRRTSRSQVRSRPWLSSARRC